MFVEVADPVDDRFGLLCRCRVVEPDQRAAVHRLLQDGEIATDGMNVEARMGRLNFRRMRRRRPGAGNVRLPRNGHAIEEVEPGVGWRGEGRGAGGSAERREQCGEFPRERKCDRASRIGCSPRRRSGNAGIVDEHLGRRVGWRRLWNRGVSGAVLHTRSGRAASSVGRRGCDCPGLAKGGTGLDRLRE